MIFAVHLGTVRILHLQDDTPQTLGQKQLGRKLSAILKRTDIPVTYHTVVHVISVFLPPCTYVFVS